MLDGLVASLAGIAVVSLAVTWLFQLQVWRILKRPTPAAKFTPPISVLKPLSGIDEGLLENLRSIARQDYPNFEILFGMERHNDPAHAVVGQLRQEFPNVAIKVVTGGPQLGLNPKVNNLENMCKHARYEHLLISDANVRVDSGYLRAMASEMADPEVGLVCSVLAGSHGHSVGALFEDLQLNTFIAPAICGARELGDHVCVVGKSMLLRSRDLFRLGGWEGVRDILAEDYILGQRYHASGWKVAMSSHIVQAVHEHRSLREFAGRHLRWAQMRRRVAVGPYLGELLLNPTPAGVALLIAARQAGSNAGLACGGVVLLLKCLADAGVSARLSGRNLSLREILAIPGKDLLIAAIWVMGAVRRDVVWRGHKLRIGPGSALTRPQHDLDVDVLMGAGPAASAACVEHVQ